MTAIFSEISHIINNIFQIDSLSETEMELNDYTNFLS